MGLSGIISIPYKFRLRFCAPPLCRRWWGGGVLISVPFLIIFCTQIAPLYEKSSVFRKFFQKISTSKNRPCYIPNSFLTRCTVDTDTPQIAAVSRIDLPARSERITFPYSSCLRSFDLTLPTLRPIFTPFTFANSRPEFNR